MSRIDTVVIKTEVFQYDELSDNAKEFVKRQMIQVYHDDISFTDMVEERIGEDFPNSKLEIQYSLASCQGDGFNIYGVMSLSDLVKQIKTDEDIIGTFDEKEKRFIDFLEKQDIDIKLDCNYRYCYCTDKKEDIRYWIEYDLENQFFRDIPYDTIEKFSRYADTYLHGYCKKFEEEGYEWFYEMEDDELKEIIKENGYEFTEIGKIY